MTMDLNRLGKRSYECALRRGKIHEMVSDADVHFETISGLTEEVNEVIHASETEASEHLCEYPAVVEELTDVILVGITELHRRGVDIEDVLDKKMKYNEQRK